MAFRFPEQSPLEELFRAAWYRVVGGPRRWHNRGFASRQAIERDDLGFTIRWDGRGELRAKGLRDLRRRGDFVSVLASGPSVRSLRRPERLFDAPVCCVNGSVEMAAAAGRRAAYYLVSDHRFILEKPELFRAGTRVSDAVVLGPMSAFAAMLVAPDALDGVELFLREDLRRPFKRPRPTDGELRRDPHVIANASGDLVFSLDPLRGTCPASTVVFDALQVLYGIGYREVFMFGVDLSDGPRFYAEKTPAPNELSQAYERRIEPAFELVAQYLRRSGRRLVNGSPASRLPDSIVPKADGNTLLDLIERRGAARGMAGRPKAA
jgi:hypothetical protein